MKTDGHKQLGDPIVDVRGLAKTFTQPDRTLLLLMWAAVAVIWAVAIAVFYAGLRRYESGSAINVNV